MAKNRGLKTQAIIQNDCLSHVKWRGKSAKTEKRVVAIETGNTLLSKVIFFFARYQAARQSIRTEQLLYGLTEPYYVIVSSNKDCTTQQLKGFLCVYNA